MTRIDTFLETIEKEWKKSGLSLHDHQREGILAMDSWYQAGHGGINGDEMGLGKTCQAIVMMLRLLEEGEGPFLVISPLSVVGHWHTEIKRFCCGRLEPFSYVGYSAQRQELMENMKKLHKNTVFIIPYHLMRQCDKSVVQNLEIRSGMKFKMVVVDEAQTVKNTATTIFSATAQFRQSAWILLMTGTPIQNNLNELYALLTLIKPDEYKWTTKDETLWVEKMSEPDQLPLLQDLLKKFMIRRMKEVVCKDLPMCEQVILYHNITELQKKVYLDIISKNYLAFLTGGDTSAMMKKNRNISLNNVHLQLRKCCGHPYLFKGIEPEPFKEGEHIVEASGKLQALDSVLRLLRSRNHRVLLFSQYKMILDIVQDYLELRNWEYERVDGDCRTELRQESIDRFQKGLKKKGKASKRNRAGPDPWIFLLTTKSGGVGLTLTAADTVVFLDSDWNPQNDLQAMARVHRIGQHKPVRVIRLIARFTVEQVMAQRIRNKLKFTKAIMEEETTEPETGVDLMTSIKANLGELETASNTCQISETELEALIGETDVNGHWMSLVVPNNDENARPDGRYVNPEEADNADVVGADYHLFEGVNYKISRKDEEAFERLRLEAAIENSDNRRSKRRISARNYAIYNNDEGECDEATYKKQRQKKIDEKNDEQKRKLSELRATNDYLSWELPLPEDNESVDEYGETETETDLVYLYGDVTKPKINDSERKHVVMHCVDDGGSFGTRGLFGAIRQRFPGAADRYEKMKEMKDISVGSSYLMNCDAPGSSEVQWNLSRTPDAMWSIQRSDKRFPIVGGERLLPPGKTMSLEIVYSGSHDDGKLSLVFCVVNKPAHRDEIKQDSLESCLVRVGEWAANNNATVHVSRIGYGTNLSWYAVERLLKKHFIHRGVECYVYYVKRRVKPHFGSPRGKVPQKRKMNDRNTSDHTDPDSDGGAPGPSWAITALPGKRIRRTRINLSARNAEDEDASEDESPSSSSCDDSEDEYQHDSDNSIEDEDDELRSDDEVEDESDAVVDDEELDDLVGVQTTRKRYRPDIAGEERDSLTPPNEVTDDNLDVNSDEEFVEKTLSLWRVEPEIADRCRDDWELLKDADGWKADYAIVPECVRGDEMALKTFKSNFGSSCVFLKSEWLDKSLDLHRVAPMDAYMA